MSDLEKLDNVINELEDQSNQLKEFNEVYKGVEKLHKDIAKSLNLINEHNNAFSELSGTIEAQLGKSVSQLNSVEKSLLNRVSAIEKNNKALLDELDGNLVTRLNKYYSDIQVATRNEGSQVQRAIENSLLTQFNSIEESIRSHSGSHSNEFNILKKLLLLSIGLSICSFVLLYFK